MSDHVKRLGALTPGSLFLLGSTDAERIGTSNGKPHRLLVVKDVNGTVKHHLVINMDVNAVIRDAFILNADTEVWPLAHVEGDAEHPTMDEHKGVKAAPKKRKAKGDSIAKPAEAFPDAPDNEEELEPWEDGDNDLSEVGV